MADRKEEIYLIDGSAYIYRAYHATGGLSNSKGFPTGAIFGFTNMLVKTLKEKAPKRIAVVFDSPQPTFRHEMYKDYKANRPPMPEDLGRQIPKIKEVVDAYRVPSLSFPGFEADDIIATIASRAAQKGWDVVIVSGDKDLMQLVGDRVRMWDPQRNKLYDAAAVKKKFGVEPGRVLDLLALMGDSSDNVPGVPGVGAKTAARLIDEFGSLDRIYASLDKISRKKLRENLTNYKDKALLSRDLVRLNKEVPLKQGLEDLVAVERDSARLRDLFEELEFRRFIDDLPQERTLDFSGYVTITGKQELRLWVDRLSRLGRFAIDLETTSRQPVRADLVGISLCGEDGKACYIPVGHTYGEQLPKNEVLEALRPIVEDEALRKIGQNIKYDLIVLKKE